MIVEWMRRCNLQRLRLCLVISLCLFALNVGLLKSAEFKNLVSGMLQYVPGQDGTYAQNYQDTWLLRVSKHNGWDSSGFFIDMGAHSGKWCSNSKLLEEQLGWRGICVEPFPADFEDRTCVLVKRAIAKESGETLRFSGCGHFGHIQGCQISDEAARLLAPTAISISIRDILNCVRVNRTKSEACTNIVGRLTLPTFINIISLDIDSPAGQLAVVKDFPWADFEVGVWIVERSSKDDVDGVDAMIWKEMESHGYIHAPVENPGVDHYFVLPRYWHHSLVQKPWRIHPTGSRGC